MFGAGPGDRRSRARYSDDDYSDDDYDDRKYGFGGSRRRASSRAMPTPPAAMPTRDRRRLDEYRRSAAADASNNNTPRSAKRRSRSYPVETGGTGGGAPRGGVEKHNPARVQLLLCHFQGGAQSHKWVTAPVVIDQRRDNDRDVWRAIRHAYRTQLQAPWRRIFLFQKLKTIVPIEYTRNGVPIKSKSSAGGASTQDAQQQDGGSEGGTKYKGVEIPDPHSLMHAYHHPERLRPDHEWVDWFVDFDLMTPGKTNGLEFIEGLWAEKLAALAVLLTVAIIVVSIVWCVEGGDLQTVFTVMSFVLGGVTAELALVALYYQATSLPS